MTNVRVTVPATSANLGPGLGSIALALGLYNVVELSEIEQGLSFELYGEGADTLPQDPSNKVLRAATLVFRHTGCTPSGLHIRLKTSIPPQSGLGSSAAAVLGGAIAANVLLGSPLNRDQVLRIAVELDGRPDAVSAALMGGLVVSSHAGGELIYTNVPIAPMQVVVVLPDVERTKQLDALPETVALSDAIYNIGRTALMLQALTAGDFDLLAHAVRDRLHEPVHRPLIPGCSQALDAARRHGAAAVAISGSGPALIVFTEADHEQIAHAMSRAFRLATGRPARSWILPLDTQGISISELGLSLRREFPSPVPASAHPAPPVSESSMLPRGECDSENAATTSTMLPVLNSVPQLPVDSRHRLSAEGPPDTPPSDLKASQSELPASLASALQNGKSLSAGERINGNQRDG